MARQVRGVTLAAVLAVTAGCLVDGGDGLPEPPDAGLPPSVGVSLELVQANAPWTVKVKLTNTGPNAAATSYFGFRLIDRNDTIFPPYPELMEGAGQQGYPERRDLWPTEAASGWLFFDAPRNTTFPVRVAYDHDDRTATLAVHEASSGS